jgi:hypothetical protein
MVNGFPRIEQVFPGNWKSRQSNVGRSWFTEKAVTGEKRFCDALIIGSLRPQALNQPIPGHFDSDI